MGGRSAAVVTGRGESEHPATGQPFRRPVHALIDENERLASRDGIRQSPGRSIHPGDVPRARIDRQSGRIKVQVNAIIDHNSSDTLSDPFVFLYGALDELPRPSLTRQ